MIESPKKNKNMSQATCDSLARNLFCAKTLNKEYVSFATIKNAMEAKSTNAVTRLLKKLGYDHAPYEDSMSLEEKSDILYHTLKAFQLEGLKAYLRELKTKEGQEKAKARLVRGKFPEGYQTKKKKEEEQKRKEIQQKQEKVQKDFDDWGE